MSFTTVSILYCLSFRAQRGISPRPVIPNEVDTCAVTTCAVGISAIAFNQSTAGATCQSERQRGNAPLRFFYKIHRQHDRQRQQDRTPGNERPGGDGRLGHVTDHAHE